MIFKDGVKTIQAAGYNGARMVIWSLPTIFEKIKIRTFYRSNHWFFFICQTEGVEAIALNFQEKSMTNWLQIMGQSGFKKWSHKNWPVAEYRVVVQSGRQLSQLPRGT